MAARYTRGWLRKAPAQDARLTFDGIKWRDVPDYHWAALTSYAGEMSHAGYGFGVVAGRIVKFAGHGERA